MKSQEENVYFIDDEILYIFQPPNFTVKDHAELMHQMVSMVHSHSKKVYLVVDLTEAERPNAEMREVLRTNIKSIERELIHMTIFTGKNILITVALKFVLGYIGFKSYSVHQTKEQALNRIEENRSK